MKPIIGITLDSEKGGGYSEYPFYALRKGYFDAVEKHGGTPIGLPYSDADRFINMIDGLLIPGGSFDIPPEMYGEKIAHSTVTTKDIRTNFEFAITKLALKHNKPILGICGGEQLINVACGGSLIQDIPAEIKNALNHEVKNREAPAHEVSVVEGSLLHKITGKLSIGTNTSHHQAVKDVGENLIINAKTSDGVIEGIEHTKHKFCLGLQWHPEYLFCDADSKIFDAFIKSCRN
jgi:putative glutamine amidotransferase